MNEWLIYVLTGCFTGLMAGLFGVGGGLIIVPVLLYLFAKLGFSSVHLMHMALATSLAVIVVTSTASVRSHHLNQNVDLTIAKRMAASVFIGTMLGGVLAGLFNIGALKLLFVLYTFYVATQILLGFSPNASRHLPDLVPLNLVGGIIGLVSSFVGIGGGTLTVPFLVYCNVNPKRAIGTSSAIGLPIALGGVVGYAVAGYGVSELPNLSLGFVYIPACLVIALASLMTTPIGAKLVHQLPIATIKRMFAILLYLIGLYMLFGLL